MITSHRVLLAKVETTYGQDALPVPATDSLEVETLAFAYSDQRSYQQNPTKPTSGKRKSLFGGTLGQVTFEVLLRGGAAAGTPPPIGVLLQGCSMIETISAGVSVIYTFVSTGQKSLTLYYEKDGKQYKLLGAVGTVSLVGEVGQPLKGSFTFFGHVEGPTDNPLPAPTWLDLEPPVYLNAAFKYGAYEAVIGNLSLDFALTIAKPPSVAALDGYGVLRIPDRNVTGSFNPEETLVATFDPEGDWKANAVAIIDSGVIGATAGNQIQLVCGAGQIHEPPAEGDREMISTFDVPFAAREVAGDDCVTLTFT